MFVDIIISFLYIDVKLYREENSNADLMRKITVSRPTGSGAGTLMKTRVKDFCAVRLPFTRVYSI